MFVFDGDRRSGGLEDSAGFRNRIVGFAFSSGFILRPLPGSLGWANKYAIQARKKKRKRRRRRRPSTPSSLSLSLHLALRVKDSSAYTDALMVYTLALTPFCVFTPEISTEKTQTKQQRNTDWASGPRLFTRQVPSRPADARK